MLVRVILFSMKQKEMFPEMAALERDLERRCPCGRMTVNDCGGECGLRGWLISFIGGNVEKKVDNVEERRVALDLAVDAAVARLVDAERELRAAKVGEKAAREARGRFLR